MVRMSMSVRTSGVLRSVALVPRRDPLDGDPGDEGVRGDVPPVAANRNGFLSGAGVLELDMRARLSEVAAVGGIPPRDGYVPVREVRRSHFSTSPKSLSRRRPRPVQT
jgi:hypothetical protein